MYNVYSENMCCNYPGQNPGAGTTPWSYQMLYKFEIQLFNDGSGTVPGMCTYASTEWRGNVRDEMYNVQNVGIPFGSGVTGQSTSDREIIYQASFTNDYCVLQGVPNCLYTATNEETTGNVLGASYNNYGFMTNQDTQKHVSNKYNAQTGPNPGCSSTPGAGSAYEFTYLASFSDSTPGTTVFGTYGLDTFPITFVYTLNFVDTGFNSASHRFFSISNFFPSYARFKVLPTIEFYEFSNIDFGTGLSPQPTIWITFRVSCPNADMDPSNNYITGYVGYCAQNWFITNQANENIYLGTIFGPGTVSEPQPGLPTAFAAMTSLGDVYGSAVITAKLIYNDGDVLSWHFFPKAEAEQPVGTAFCVDSLSAIAGTPYLISPFSITVPAQSKAMLPMICSIRAVPAACEFNTPQMLCSCFRGEGYITEVSIAQDLSESSQVGNPLDYAHDVNYYVDWTFTNGTHLEGFDVYFLPYEAGAEATVYDQENVIAGLTTPVPILIPTYTNPLARQPSCTDTTGTCFLTTDDTEDPNFTRLVPYPYCANGANALILKPVLVFTGNFSFNDQVGALYCNLTTENIDVFTQEQQTKALFGIFFECNVTQTGFYTYTVRYGKSIQAFVAAGTYPCYERLITYAIVLTSFQIDPQPLIRIPQLHADRQLLLPAAPRRHGQHGLHRGHHQPRHMQRDSLRGVPVRDRHVPRADAARAGALSGGDVHLHCPVPAGAGECAHRPDDLQFL